MDVVKIGDRIPIEVDGKRINTKVIDIVPSLYGGGCYIVKIKGEIAAVSIEQPIKTN